MDTDHILARRANASHLRPDVLQASRLVMSMEDAVSQPSSYRQRDQPRGVPPLELTGERTLPDVPEENYWLRRHLVVYEWIAGRVRGLRAIDMACGEGYGSGGLARS